MSLSQVRKSVSDCPDLLSCELFYQVLLCYERPWMLIRAKALQINVIPGNFLIESAGIALGQKIISVY